MLFLCVGCNNESEPTEQPTQSSETLGQNDTQNKARALYVPKVEIDPKLKFKERTYSFPGFSFEEQLTRATTTDVVIGEYLGAAYVIPNYYFFFKVDKLIKGEIHQETIAVCTDISNYYILACGDVDNRDEMNTLSIITSLPLSPPKIPDGQRFYSEYRKGKHYLLLLNRVSTPHLDTEDLLRFTEESIGIPVDDTGAPIIASSKMYQLSLASTIKTDEVKERVAKGELIDVILELTKDDVYEESSVNIVDKDTVLSNATHIINVEICYQNREYKNDLYSRYDCKIISVEKGEYKRETGSFSLTDAKVKIGGKYTIALDEKGKLISRNAIFPYTE